jgi:hypothetical protein
MDTFTVGESKFPLGNSKSKARRERKLVRKIAAGVNVGHPGIQPGQSVRNPTSVQQHELLSEVIESLRPEFENWGFRWEKRLPKTLIPGGKTSCQPDIGCFFFEEISRRARQCSRAVVQKRLCLPRYQPLP